MATSPPNQPLPTPQTDAHAHAHAPDAEALIPLEQDVLDEYARLLGNLNHVRAPPLTPA